jgi:hypothetical protein
MFSWAYFPSATTHNIVIFVVFANGQSQRGAEPGTRRIASLQ